MDIGGAAARLEIDGDEAFSRGGRAPIDVRRARLGELELELEEASRILWCTMHPSGRACFTHALLNDMGTAYAGVRQLFADLRPGESAPFDYFVFGSRTPGIYNLGGDLAHFAKMVRVGDREAMRRYAHVCIDRQYENSQAFGVPVVTISLVRGDALGGGFEHALSHDLIIAERSAKLGLPEVLFNLFPGMGAYSFIKRRVGRQLAEEFILSGRVHTGEELHAMGIVDVLAEDGQGEDALRQWIAQAGRKLNMRRAVYQARRLVDPVTYDELIRITDLWVEAAMNLDERDVRIMDRLYAAQDRRMVTARAQLHVI